MRIVLKIMGRKLYELLTKEMASLNSAFPKRYKQGKLIDWQLRLIDDNLGPDDLNNPPSSLSVILIDAHDLHILEKLKKLEKQEYLYLNSLPDFPFGVAPIILLFHDKILTPDLMELPNLVSDWLLEPMLMHDIVRRIFASLRRRQLFQSELRFGVLTLIPDSRKISYSGNSALLTPSEMAVAELFLHHFGSVIMFEDIVLVFKLAGKSTEGSNIRVTMFQLRFKIEAITNCQITLMSIYKEGYSLRHSKNYDQGFPFQDLEARQEVAVYDD
jgi:DNA-binding winged helix-turn-helix (wHTH) protein